MSLLDTLNAAAASAQSTLAQLGGATFDSTGALKNTLIIDTKVKCLGVYGQAILQNVPMPGGGYRQRAAVPLSITQDQLATPPLANARLTRLDVVPAVTYIIDYVNTHGNLSYDLMLVRLGE